MRVGADGFRLTCNHEKCVDDRRQGRKHITCPRNGRKLREALRFAMDVAEDMKQLSRCVTLEACGGDRVVHKQIVDMLGRGSVEIKLRLKYLNVVPWAFARADEQQGAIHVLEQMTQNDLKDHVPLSRDIWRRLEGDVRRVANGEEASAELAKDVNLINWPSLDESAGEGYHRATNAEKTRARNASMMHLKGTARHKQHLRRCIGFARTHGQRGENVFRYEWRRWKRIVKSR